MNIAARVDVTLQCPKCGQMMSFVVEQGDDALAVCDRCHIPMRKMAKLIKTEREVDLEGQVSELKVQISALTYVVERLQKQVNPPYRGEETTERDRRTEERSLFFRVRNLEHDVHELHRAKAKKVLKKDALLRSRKSNAPSE